MAAANDILQLVVRSTYLGQNITNVFHYRVNVVGGTLTSTNALNTAFAAICLSPWRAFVNSGQFFTDFYTVNLNDPADMDTWVVGAAGTVAATLAQQLPSYIATVFKFERTSAAFRNGWKRLAGCYDDMTTGNTWSGNTTQANAVASAFQSTLTQGVGPSWSFQPFIARRPIVYGSNPLGYATNVVTFKGVSTQNTRKP